MNDWVAFWMFCSIVVICFAFIVHCLTKKLK